MKQTEKTLLEQMRITEFEFANRKTLFALMDEDFRRLQRYRSQIEARIDHLVDRFYQMQTEVAEIALLIGDADTLGRLRNAQRRYVLDLFSGVYDLEYVNNRLRIGLVHKRIGVEPKLYLSAVNSLKSLLLQLLDEIEPEPVERRATTASLEKLMLFDITLVFETYIRSLVTEIEISREKSESYARVLEEKVKERTTQLEEMMRVDALTGLLNVRTLNEQMLRTLRSAQRRSEPVSLVYLDVNDFKKINDSEGHQRGDDILRRIGDAIRKVSRAEDSCYRYGGDEFCIVLPNCDESMARQVYVERLGAELGDAISISAGIVQTGPQEYGEPEALVRLADARMYESKRKRQDIASLAA